jgi:hypothetical protein
MTIGKGCLFSFVEGNFIGDNLQKITSLKKWSKEMLYKLWEKINRKTSQSHYVGRKTNPNCGVGSWKSSALSSDSSCRNVSQWLPDWWSQLPFSSFGAGVPFVGHMWERQPSLGWIMQWVGKFFVSRGNWFPLILSKSSSFSCTTCLLSFSHASFQICEDNQHSYNFLVFSSTD